VLIGSCLREDRFGPHSDIVMKSETALQRDRDNVGVTSYYALREGISV